MIQEKNFSPHFLRSNLPGSRWTLFANKIVDFFRFSAPRPPTPPQADPITSLATLTLYINYLSNISNRLACRLLFGTVDFDLPTSPFPAKAQKTAFATYKVVRAKMVSLAPNLPSPGGNYRCHQVIVSKKTLRRYLGCSLL